MKAFRVPSVSCRAAVSASLRHYRDPRQPRHNAAIVARKACPTKSEKDGTPGETAKLGGFVRYAALADSVKGVLQ